MNFHPLGTDTKIPYPIGCNMAQTLHVIKHMAETFRKVYPEPEKNSFAFLMRGASGNVTAGILASFLPEYHIQLYPVRKPHESSHCGRGPLLPDRDATVVIVDDFMASGETINAIKEQYLNYKVDTLILSGDVACSRFEFIPNNLIAARLVEE